MTDTFANRARELFVGPCSGARFEVGRDVWRDQPRKSILRELRSRTFLSGLRLRAGRVPVNLRMAFETVRNAFDEVPTALQTRSGALESVGTFLRAVSDQRNQAREHDNDQ